MKLIGSAGYGRGIVVAKLKDGTWSQPCAIETVEVGVGKELVNQLLQGEFILAVLVKCQLLHQHLPVVHAKFLNSDRLVFLLIFAVEI